MYSKQATSPARSSKEKATGEKAHSLLLTADLGETGTVQPPPHISHWGLLPPGLGFQGSQMLLGTRSLDFWQLKESHSKRC